MPEQPFDIRTMAAAHYDNGEIDADADLQRKMFGMTNEQKHKFLREERRRLQREIRPLERNRAELTQKIKVAHAFEERLSDLQEWGKLVPKLERPSGSSAHHFRQALLDGDAIFCRYGTEIRLADFGEAFKDANIFVVEHDWSTAFAGAGEFSEGEFRLPFEVCAFEFKITGHRVIALMTEVDGNVMMQLMVRAKTGWAIDDDISRHENGKWFLYHGGRSQGDNIFERIVHFVGANVRAICIALEAEVAKREMIRASHKLNHSREKLGRVPANAYHIVSLASRARAEERGSGEPEYQGKVRLHFRRGHWRHFATFKTWIRWMLVGNPDLGFIDKEYRL